MKDIETLLTLLQQAYEIITCAHECEREPHEVMGCDICEWITTYDLEVLE